LFTNTTLSLSLHNLNKENMFSVAQLLANDTRLDKSGTCFGFVSVVRAPVAVGMTVLVLGLAWLQLWFYGFSWAWLQLRLGYGFG
jgi:hypothetical protein